jgi:preprotein translocase subunit YajC
MLALLAQNGSQGGNPFSFLILLAPIAILYFIMIRPQRRRMQAQQALLKTLEVGDEVMTTGGIFGTIIDIDEDEDVITLEIAPGTRVRMLRAGVSRKLVEDLDEEEADDEGAGEPS